ncbi:MAG TPA: HEAT repeat domain-containing protein [Chthoniobacterales bacterium]|nr:HEAT repeat domain-containing protein [Chthoniobacterales bacterium]
MKIGTKVFLAFVTLCALPAGAQNRLALVIGIAGYPGFPEGERLKYAGRDAEAFAAFIETPRGGSFQPQNVHLVTNSDAKRERLYQEFDWLYETSGPNDTVYVFFAGHGMEYRTGSYFLPYDASKNHPDALGIQMSEFFRRVTTDIAAKQVAVFIDACHSASAGEGQRSPSILDIQKQWGQQNDKAGQVSFGLFSSLANQSSWEDLDLGGGHGLFTWYLLEGMQGAAPRTAEGWITADNLLNYIKGKVEERSRAKFPQIQTPYASSRFRTDFIFSYAPPKAGDPSGELSTEALIEKLTNADYSEAQFIIGQLAAKGLSAVNPVLHAKIGSGITDIYLKDVLGGIGKKAVPLLIEALQDDNPSVRQIAAGGLRRVGDKSAVPALLRAFSRPDASGEIDEIAFALSAIGDPSIVDPMIKVLENGDSGRAYGAARVLEGVGPPARAAVPALISAMQNSNNKWLYCDALAAIGDDRAVPALAAYLETVNSSFGESQAPLRALAKFGRRAAPAVPQIIRTNLTPNFMAVDALKAVGYAGVPYLVKALHDENANVRAFAAQALGFVGLSDEATDALRKLSEDPKQPPFVTRAAQDALKGIGLSGNKSHEIPDSLPK